MKKTLILASLICTIGIVGCTTSTTTATPLGTNTVTVVKGIDQATLSQIESLLAQGVSNAPAIVALIHGAPAIVVTNAPAK